MRIKAIASRARDMINYEKIIWRYSRKYFGVLFFYSFSRILIPFRGNVRWFGTNFSADNKTNAVLSLPKYLEECNKVISLFENNEFKYVLDIGANVGQWASTLLALDANVFVICVEPNFHLQKILNSNLEKYKERCIVISMAVGPKQNLSAFYYSEKKSGQGSLFSENAQSDLISISTVKKIMVEEGPITHELIEKLSGKSIPIFDFVKIDVEGYESQVLKGIETLSWDKISIEVIKNRMGGITKVEALELLKTFSKDTEFIFEYDDNCYFSSNKV